MKTDEKPVKRKGAGAETAYQALRDGILSLTMGPGSDLDEGTLVRSLGLSRTPVREAIIRLASEGLVTLTPNRGARVAPISLDEVRAFFEALDLCQRAVTRFAAVRRRDSDLARMKELDAVFEAAARRGDVGVMARSNLDLHLVIAEASGNAWIARLYGELLSQGMRLSRMALVYDPPAGRSRLQHARDVVDEHRRMLAAIAVRDADAAEKIASEHAGLFRRRVMGFVEENLAVAVAVA